MIAGVWRLRGAAAVFFGLADFLLWEVPRAQRLSQWHGKAGSGCPRPVRIIPISLFLIACENGGVDEQVSKAYEITSDSN